MTKFGFHTTSDEACEVLKDNIVGKRSKPQLYLNKIALPESLGADTARAIAVYKPAKLILASQTESKLQEVIKSLQVPAETSIHSLVLDLASLDAVRRAAAELSIHFDSVDAMILHCWRYSHPVVPKSKDGIELQFAINRLGHFIFIKLTVDKLLAGDVMVVTYTREAHTRGTLNFLDGLTYSGGKTYEK
ncbi:hypothetical protein ACJ41O_009008 [Fusarium nematophilum]